MTETGTGWFGTRPIEAPKAPVSNVAAPTEREAFLDEAIKAGRFTEKRRDHYAALYDRDPLGTRKLVAALQAGPGAPASGQGTGWF